MGSAEGKVECIECGPASSVPQSLQASRPVVQQQTGCAVQSSPARLW